MPKHVTVDHKKLWKILKEMGIPDHLTSLLRNLYVGEKATVRTGHGTTDWFQIGKAVRQGCALSPCLLNLYAEYIMRNTGLEEAQAGIKIARTGTSLMVQWLRICLAMQRTWVQSLVGELRSHMPQSNSACVLQLLSPCTASRESVCRNERSPMTQGRSHMPQLRPNTAT